MDHRHGPGNVPAGVVVFAHLGQPLAPHDLWRAWTFEPVTVGLLALSGWMYWRGLTRLWHAAGTGRGVRRADAYAFAAGWLILALARLGLGSFTTAAALIESWPDGQPFWNSPL